MAGVLDMETGELLARLRAGFDWWTGELAALAAPLLRPIGRRGGGLVAVAEGAGYAFYRDGALSGRADPARPSEAALALPETVALVRETPAPGLGERDWRRILMDEIDRLTPFAPDDVYATLAFSGEGDGRIARLAVAPRQRLQAVVAEARAAGVAPVALLAHAPDGSAVDLAPVFRAASGQGRPSARRTWWGAVALLLVLNLGAAVWRDVSRTRRLEVAAADLQPAADRLRRLRQDVETQTAERRDLLARRAQGDPLAVLGQVTAALPQGAFVERFELQGQTLRLAGRRGTDVDVAAALRAAGFRQVRDASTDLSPSVPDTARTVAFDLTALAPPPVGAAR